MISKKALILGGAGFIGYHLAQYLLGSEIEIHLVDNLQRGRMDDDLKSLLKKPNVLFFEGDLTEKEIYGKLCSHYDYVYLLASVVGVQGVSKDPCNVLKTNALVVMRTFDWLKTIKVGRFLFSSTSEVGDGAIRHFNKPIPTPENVMIVFDDLFQPRITYAISKTFCESYVISYCSKYQIPYNIVRYYNVYGPRMGYEHVIPELFRKALQPSAKFVVSSLNHSRCFCYIDDAIRATYLVANSKETPGKIVNIGNSKEEIRILDLAKKILHISKVNKEIIDGHETPGSPFRRCPDTTFLENTTRFVPSVSLEVGLQRMFSWNEKRIQTTFK